MKRSYLQTGAVCVESLNGVTLICGGITLDLQQVIHICIFDMMTKNRYFVSGGYWLSLVCDVVIMVAYLVKLSSHEDIINCDRVKIFKYMYMLLFVGYVEVCFELMT